MELALDWFSELECLFYFNLFIASYVFVFPLYLSSLKIVQNLLIFNVMFFFRVLVAESFGWGGWCNRQAIPYCLLIFSCSYYVVFCFFLYRKKRLYIILAYWVFLFICIDDKHLAFVLKYFWWTPGGLTYSPCHSMSRRLLFMKYIFWKFYHGYQ